MEILLAEDDDLLRRSLDFFLTQHGYKVTAIANGMEAFEAMKRSHFDLVITDLNMPYTGGMELINMIRKELNLPVPVIVLTSSNVEHTELEAFSMGASEFVAKPFSPLVLKARIEKLTKSL
jgi:two-component system, OmpR family, response regulator Irr